MNSILGGKVTSKERKRPPQTSLVHGLVSAFKLIEEAWDVDTSHYSRVQIAGRGRPAGQCYVSSMFVASFLSRNGIQPLIKRGSVFRGSGMLIPDHSWVEFDYSGISWISDPTLHQVESFEQIVMLPTQELRIEYHSWDERPLRRVVNDDVLSRYAILVSRIAERGADA